MDPTERRDDDPGADDTHQGVKIARSSPTISQEIPSESAVETRCSTPVNPHERSTSSSTSSALGPTPSELDVFAYFSETRNTRGDSESPKSRRACTTDLDATLATGSQNCGDGGSEEECVSRRVFTEVQSRSLSVESRDRLSVIGLVDGKENQAELEPFTGAAFATAKDISSADTLKSPENLSPLVVESNDSDSAQSRPHVGGKTYYTVSIQDQHNYVSGNSSALVCSQSQSALSDEDQAESQELNSGSSVTSRPVVGGKTYYAVPLKLEGSLQSVTGDLPVDTDEASQTQSESKGDPVHEDAPSMEASQATTTTESESYQVSTCPPCPYRDVQPSSKISPEADADAKPFPDSPVGNASAATVMDIDSDKRVDAQSQSHPSTGGKTLSTSAPRPDDSMEVDDEEEVDEDEDEDEEDDEKNADSDASSEVSDGEDLRGDLLDALSSSFTFTGSYAYASSYPEAPNPCLYIASLGPVGLPLSPRDACHLIAVAAQAPYGHGTETVVNTKVRDTWEIDANRVKFDNPIWEDYIQKTVVKNVVQALGVSVDQTKMPRAELYKLLVYEQGSHFLPHQDTVKTPGMFATIVIVLPSLYTGGQVHVSHASTSQVFDFASTSNPLLTTSVLAWYTDVKHEVKPVTSGYRLALSYNLVHFTPGVPLPALPDGFDQQVAELRSVLRKWRKGGYEDADGSYDVLAHILNHQYSQANLAQGVKALKGTDAHLLAHLIPVAKEQGFFLGLASLECHKIGDAGEESYGYGGYHKRSRRGYGGWGYNSYSDDDEDEGCPSMGEVQDTIIKVDNLVDMDGNKPIGSNKLPIGEEELVERDAFEDADPDDEEYEGYMGNYSGSVEHWYRRTVLVLMPEDSAESIMFNAGGSTYALEKLRASQAVSSLCSEDDLRVANLIIRNLSSQSAAVCVTMTRYAVSWNNLDLWRRILKVCTLSTLSIDELVKGWRTFTFPSVRMSFEDMVARSSKLSESVAFIQALASRAAPGPEKEVVEGWQRYVVGGLLSTLKAPAVEDVPVLMNVAKTKGAQYILHQFIPQLEANSKLHKFWMAFVKALQKDRPAILLAETSAETLSNAVSPSSTSEIKYERLVRRCLEIIVKYWETDLASNPKLANVTTYSYYRALPVPSITHYDRVAEILDLALDAKALDEAKNFLALVRKSKPPAEHFPKLYTPLISHIRKRLSRNNSNVFSPPFSDFMHLIVTSVKAPTGDDVPWLMEVFHLKGIQYLLSFFIPQVEKDRTLYPFWQTFLKSFQSERSKIIASSLQAGNSADKTQEVVRTFGELCLNLAVSSWEHALSSTGSRSYNTSVPTPQSLVMELVELCTSMDVLTPCKRLFGLLVKRKPVTEGSVKTVYSPLLPQLRQHLLLKGLDILSHPFVDFLQVLIGTYLRSVLGAKPQQVAVSRKVGCGCFECNEMDKFLVSPQAEHTFRYVLGKRNHLEQRLSRARDIVTTSTIRSGSPHGLVVKKSPSVIAWCNWTSRQKQALAFLKSIGNDEFIAKIAGSRYADICKALEGTQQFTLPWNTTPVPAVGGSSNTTNSVPLTARRDSHGVNPTPAAPSSIPSTSNAHAAHVVAGGSSVPLTAWGGSCGVQPTPAAPISSIPGPVPPSSTPTALYMHLQPVGGATSAHIAPAAPSAQLTMNALAARFPSVSSSTQAFSSTATATTGTKRKKAPLCSTIIDLTGEDSS